MHLHTNCLAYPDLRETNTLNICILCKNTFKKVLMVCTKIPYTSSLVVLS